MAYKVSYQNFETTEFEETDEPVDNIKVFKTLGQAKKDAIERLKFTLEEIKLNISIIRSTKESDL